MKRLVILGAGRMGIAAAELLNTSSYELAAFADNNPELHGTVLFGAPVLPLEKAISLSPDELLVGVLDGERSSQLTEQACALGYKGIIRYLGGAHELYDARAASVRRLAKRINGQGIKGDIAELGVYKGDFAAELSALFTDRTLWLFDTFEGFDERDASLESERGYSRAVAGDFADTSAEAVLARLQHPERAIIRKGFFPDTADGVEASFVFVSLDADLYAPTLAGLRFFWPRLERGGALLLHDWGGGRFSGVREAVAQFEREIGALPLVPLCDLHGLCVAVKA